MLAFIYVYSVFYIFWLRRKAMLLCAGYIRTMSGGGVTYNVYVWSYLGYGLMQGRGAVLGTSGSGSCINAGSTGSFKSPYGDGGDIPLESSPTGGDAQECQKAVVDAMHVGKDCDAAAKLCTFDGRWGAVESHKGRSFYVSSYFFDKCVLRVLLSYCPEASSDHPRRSDTSPSACLKPSIWTWEVRVQSAMLLLPNIRVVVQGSGRRHCL